MTTDPDPAPDDLLERLELDLPPRSDAEAKARQPYEELIARLGALGLWRRLCRVAADIGLTAEERDDLAREFTPDGLDDLLQRFETEPVPGPEGKDDPVIPGPPGSAQRGFVRFLAWKSMKKSLRRRRRRR